MGLHAALAGAFAVLDPAALAARLDLGDPAGWRRTYGRFDPDRDPWATVLLERAADGAAVTVEALRGPGGELSAASVVARRFPDDPALPHLAEVVARHPGLVVRRYRPRLRCTLVEDAPGGRFAKVLPAEALGAARRDIRALWDADLPFRVAAPFPDEDGVVWQGRVPGWPVADEILAPGGEDLSRRVGRALAGLTRAAVAPSATIGDADQWARTQRAAAHVRRRVPELAEGVDAVLRRLEPLRARAEGRPLVPVHGAPHLHQWLDDGESLGLVDFDRFALGVPELDLATYLAELDFEGRAKGRVGDHERALLAGFAEGGGSADPVLVDAYRAHKRLAKVARTAWAVRPDGDRRAARHLDGVFTGLERLGG